MIWSTPKAVQFFKNLLDVKAPLSKSINGRISLFFVLLWIKAIFYVSLKDEILSKFKYLPDRGFQIMSQVPQSWLTSFLSWNSPKNTP